MISALATEIAGVDARMPWWQIVVGQPDGTEWTAVSTLADASFIDGLYARMLHQADGRADVAAVYAAAMTGILVEPVVNAVVVDRRAWRLDAHGQWLRFDRGGFVTACLIAPATPVWVLPGDAFAEHADVVVFDDGDALIDAVGESIVRIVRPILVAIRRVAPYGLAGLWGGIADEIGSVAVRSAHESGLDVDACWKIGEALIAAMRRRVDASIVGPSCERIDWEAGSTSVTLKGTCCLLYKLAPCRTDAAYCTRCPLLSRDARHDRWAEWLREGHPPR